MEALQRFRLCSPMDPAACSLISVLESTKLEEVTMNISFMLFRDPKAGEFAAMDQSLNAIRAPCLKVVSIEDTGPVDLERTTQKVRMALPLFSAKSFVRVVKSRGQKVRPFSFVSWIMLIFHARMLAYIPKIVWCFAAALT